MTEKIFNNIERNPESYKRYLVAAFIELADGRVRSAVRAFIINDELYEDVMNDHLSHIDIRFNHHKVIKSSHR